MGGALRSTERISVGTREQLSTLYRLALAEYLKTAVVLDDQLVQSDGTRMDWFRALLSEKARGFQIVVFTCRPGDYLAAGAMVAKGKVDFEGHGWWVHSGGGPRRGRFSEGRRFRTRPDAGQVVVARRLLETGAHGLCSILLQRSVVAWR